MREKRELGNKEGWTRFGAAIFLLLVIVLSLGGRTVEWAVVHDAPCIGGFQNSSLGIATGLSSWPPFSSRISLRYMSLFGSNSAGPSGLSSSAFGMTDSAADNRPPKSIPGGATESSNGGKGIDTVSEASSAQSVVQNPQNTPQIVSNAGVFTNKPGNAFLQSNVNGINPFAEFALVQAGNYSTFGIIGAVAVPPGPTGDNGFPGGIGVGGFAASPCNSHSRTQCGAVGGYFSGRAAGNNAAAWGINPLVTDGATFVTGANLVGDETDVGIVGSPAFVRGISILEGGSGTMPTHPDGASIGIEVHCGTSGMGTCWQYSATFANTFPASPRYAIQSPGWTAWISNYYTGNGSGLDQLRLAIGGGTGANPFINYIWQHPYGTSGVTTWGPQSPLTFGIFTTEWNAVSLPLSRPYAAYNKVVTIPNDTSSSDTVVLAAEKQTLSNKSTPSGPLTGAVASGTAMLASGSVASLTCQSSVTSSAMGVETMDTIEWSYSGAPGIGDGLMSVQTYVTSGSVNFTRCNPTATTQLATAMAINWRVVR